MCVPRFSLMLSRGNTGWEGVFAELGKGEKTRDFLLNRRERKLLGVLAKQDVVKWRTSWLFSRLNISTEFLTSLLFPRVINITSDRAERPLIHQGDSWHWSQKKHPLTAKGVKHGLDDSGVPKDRANTMLCSPCLCVRNKGCKGKRIGEQFDL